MLGRCRSVMARSATGLSARAALAPSMSADTGRRPSGPSTARRAAPAASPTDRTAPHVLVAADGPRVGRAAVAATVMFPWPERSRVSAVIARGRSAAGDRAEPAGAIARRALARRRPAAEIAVVNATVLKGIRSEAERFRANATEVGSHSHHAFRRLLRGVRRLLLGSVAMGVVNHSRVSVLVGR